MRAFLVLLILPWFWGLTGTPARAVDLRSELDSSPREPRRRYPVALALSEDGSALWVANRNGSLSLVSARSREVVGEWELPGELSDLASLPGDGGLLVSIADRSELVWLTRSADGMKERARVTVPENPHRLERGFEGSHPEEPVFFLSSRWGRAVSRVRCVENSSGFSLEVETTTELGFSPGELLRVPSRKLLIVTGAFGGEVAVLDSKGRVQVRGELAGHNIRGIALSGSGRDVMFAHQILNPLARTSFEDVHWGQVLRNVLRRVPVDELLVAGKPGRKRFVRGETLPLGSAGKGAADPGSLVDLGGGRWAVALAGVGEVAIVHPGESREDRVSVGPVPSELLVDEVRGALIVAVTFGDEVVWVPTGSASEAPKLQRLARRASPEELASTRVSLGPLEKETSLELGERRFRDASLSHDGWMSCQSCHPEGHSNGLLCDTLGDDTYGTPKRVLSLRGVDETAPYAWNGSQPTLEAQIEKTLRSTMHADEIPAGVIEGLAHYLRSLGPVPLGGGISTDVDSLAAIRGEEVFSTSGCVRCHTPPLYTGPETYDVGIADERGERLFNPPSLRGVALRSRYLHDGRASSLEELLQGHHHPGVDGFTRVERADLAAFLRTL